MKKILVVDDNSDILAVMKLYLNNKGFNVVTESNGSEAHNVVNAFKPDLIILDVFLGNSDGRKICNELKMQEETKNTPIIIFSANAKPDDVMKACSANEFLPKPFELSNLLKIIQRYTSN